MKRIFLPVFLVSLALGVGGCEHLSGKHSYTTLRIFLQTTPQLPPSERSTVVITNPPLSITVKRLPELTELDLDSAKAIKTESRKQIVLQFDRRGRIIVENFTTERKGELYVLILNGVAIAAPAIRDIIRDGKLSVDVDLPDEDVDKLVAGLNKAAKKAHSL